MRVAYYRQLRPGCLPQSVMMTHEGERFYIDAPIGRMPVLNYDWIQYDKDWNPIGVVRSNGDRAALPPE
jgi:hypothetical protein